MKILITGFEPFDDRLNASAELVRSLRDDLPAPLAKDAERLDFVILPTEVERVWPVLLDRLERLQPDLCLLTGQARGRSQIHLERLATNLMDFDRPDARGRLVRGQTIIPDGPPAYWSTVPDPHRLVEAMTAAGLPAGFSNHAGNHLCNRILYQCLHHASVNGLPVTATFVHLPLLPEQAAGTPATPSLPLADSRAALTLMLRLLLEADPETRPPR